MSNIPDTNITAALEALLFIYGEPISIKKACRVLSVSPEVLTQAANELKAVLSAASRGLMLIEHQESLQLVTKPEFGQLLQEVVKSELNEALSPASLETLSVIAYGGPISRADVDYIRGVNSTFTVRALLLRGLISRAQDPQRANSYLYSASIELLQHLGVRTLTELPEYEKFRQLAHSIRTSASTGAVANKSDSGITQANAL